VVITNWQSRETDKTGHTRRRKTQYNMYWTPQYATNTNSI